MKKNFKIYWLLIPISAIVLVDEWIKYFCLTKLPPDGSLVNAGILDFAIHKNWGLAFDIPFKKEFIIFFSILIGIILLRVVVKNWQTHPCIVFGSLIILLGACGNLYDRVVYGFTVDYLIWFGRSAINFSDCVIVSGVVILLFASRKSRTNKLSTPEN